MFDEFGRILYVGQSGNLRRRLGSYKNIRADKDPPRLVRLAQTVHRIDWEVCDTCQNACLRENELLRLHRPKFNRVNTRPEAYGFIGLLTTEVRFELWLTQVPEDSRNGELFGAFKGIRTQAYGALLRLLLQSLQPEKTEFPPRFLRPPRQYGFDLDNAAWPVDPGQLAEWFKGYLAGISNELIVGLRQCLPKPEALPAFWQNVQALDLETAELFFERGPRRNREFREQHGIQDRLISPMILDDVLVLHKREKVSPASAVTHSRQESECT